MLTLSVSRVVQYIYTAYTVASWRVESFSLYTRSIQTLEKDTMSELGDIAKLKVPELKAALKDRGLAVSGTKQVK